MNRKIIIAASHEYELSPVISILEKSFVKHNFFEYRKSGVSIFPMVLGIGSTMVTYGLSSYRNWADIDQFVYIGLGAGLNDNVKIGETYNVVSDQFADIGITDRGHFSDMFDLELFKRDKYPFNGRQILNETIDLPFHLDIAIGATVNKIVYNEDFRKTIEDKYQADLVSFDGACIHYCCRMFNIKFLHVRAISSHLDHTEKSNTEKALDQLSQFASKFLNSLK